MTGHYSGFNSAADLRNLRRLAGLTQSQLGTLAQFSREAVYYHEARNGRIDGVAPLAFREVFEANGLHVPGPGEPPVTLPVAAIERVCGAKTADGPCQRPVRSSGRCGWHGGMSTGPRTPEGKARIAQAQLKRHAAQRDSRV